MLMWVIRVLLLRTLLRRFWLFALIAMIAWRFLPREQTNTHYAG